MSGGQRAVLCEGRCARAWWRRGLSMARCEGAMGEVVDSKLLSSSAILGLRESPAVTRHGANQPIISWCLQPTRISLYMLLCCYDKIFIYAL